MKTNNPARKITTIVHPEPSWKSGRNVILLAGVGQFSDAGTTPQVTNNGSIQQWNDQSPFGNHLSQATSGNRPTLVTNAVNGFPTVRFANKWLTRANVLSSESYSFAFVHRANNSTLGKVLVGGATNRSLIGNTSTLGLLRFVHAGVTYGEAVANDAFAINTWYAIVVTWNHATKLFTCYWAGSPMMTSGKAIPSDYTDTGLQLGTYNDRTPTNADFYIAEFHGWNRCLSQNECFEVDRYFRGKFNLQNFITPQKLVLFVGNSLTYGTTASSGGGTMTGTVYPAVAMTTLTASGFVGLNFGTSGKTGTQFLSEGFYYDGLGGPVRNSVLVYWEITNDLANGASAATTYANVVSFCRSRRGAGFKVIVLTCLPRSTSPTFETNRLAVNANIVANWQTFADGLCDVGANATIGAAGSQNNTTYYNADKTHLTDAGYALVAGLVANSVNAL